MDWAQSETGADGQCRYETLLREREGNDRQVHGEAQTLNPLLKAKETQTEARSTSTAECQASGALGLISCLKPHACHRQGCMPTMHLPPESKHCQDAW